MVDRAKLRLKNVILESICVRKPLLNRQWQLQVENTETLNPFQQSTVDTVHLWCHANNWFMSRAYFQFFIGIN